MAKKKTSRDVCTISISVNGGMLEFSGASFIEALEKVPRILFVKTKVLVVAQRENKKTGQVLVGGRFLKRLPVNPLMRSMLAERLENALKNAQ